MREIAALPPASRAILSLLHAQTLCGLINVVTKSGGDQFHGSVFEFLRNTNLDARGYFSPERSTFQQTLARIGWMGRGSSDSARARIACAVGPVNGGSPASISYNTQPRA